MQSSPWLESEGEERVDWPNPARRFVGGVGQGAREVQAVEAHLLMGLGWVRGGRSGAATTSREAAAEGNGDGEAPMKD